MQLFTRRVSLIGPPADTLAYATEMRALASDLAGREISLWAASFGAPLGTMTYTMRVEGLADMQAVSAKVLGDNTYLQKVAKGQEYSGGPAEDALFQPLFGELPEGSPPIGSVALATSARIANGAYEEAIAWGIDMAQHATAVTGVPTMFLMESYGGFGSVGWIGVNADAAQADAAGNALNADADYLKKLGAVRDLFVEGSGHRILSTRVA
jgi:hypothetical protein